MQRFHSVVEKWSFFRLECDDALGMESNRISDSLIRASSQLSHHVASQARLNTGTFNGNAWCAASNDRNQYLQVCHFNCIDS